MNIGTWAGIIAIVVTGLATLLFYSACVVSGRISHIQSDASAHQSGRRSPPSGNEQSSREV